MAKGKHQMNSHHRKPTSIGGTSEDRNISYVNRKQHEAWHTLFSNHTAPTIVAIINEKWIDPDYEIIVRRKNETQT